MTTDRRYVLSLAAIALVLWLGLKWYMLLAGVPPWHRFFLNVALLVIIQPFVELTMEKHRAWRKRRAAIALAREWRGG